MRILLPDAKRKAGLKVIIEDNLSAHMNERVIMKCRKYNIKMVFLPANTTHLTQPHDVAFFRTDEKKLEGIATFVERVSSWSAQYNFTQG